jgi:hypothetical protein
VLFGWRAKTPTEQWIIHEYFMPDRDLSDLQLLMHRDAVTTARPSLPHQAGRALSRFWEMTARLGMKRVARAKATPPAKHVRQADSRLIVKPLVRPELAAKEPVRPYVNLARDIAKNGRGRSRHHATVTIPRCNVLGFDMPLYSPNAAAELPGRPRRVTGQTRRAGPSR